VLEIGCGWGGFAAHAAREYGCRVTATTVSRQQFDFARERLHREGLSGRVELLLQDYRDLKGCYDRLVSIEMIEAVGERYLDVFFAQCNRLTKPDGAMALQAITIPDHRYDRYRRSVDFIQRYVFPGGFLPSISAIGKSLQRGTDFRLDHLEDFGLHYAETLRIWRENFWANIQQVRQLGFDDRFVRTWHYYLCYCEAAFRERQIGVCQLTLARPDASSCGCGLKPWAVRNNPVARRRIFSSEANCGLSVRVGCIQTSNPGRTERGSAGRVDLVIHASVPAVRVTSAVDKWTGTEQRRGFSPLSEHVRCSAAATLPASHGRPCPRALNRAQRVALRGIGSAESKAATTALAERVG
jgi:cyclopropane fatty-acyl-phospholipid synthase-like methyltransferase